MDFITIDFETATSQRNSPCEIGLTFVKNRQIVETKSWLIQPENNYFDDFNIFIHGITPNETRDKPKFNDIWHELKPLLENNYLIAHNAGFDMSVLRKTLETYNLPFPNLNYTCSYIFSKKVWLGLPSYDLKTLCRHNNISLKHHRAGDDSRATAELALKAFDLAEINSFDDFSEKLKINIGQLYEGGYKASRTKHIAINKESQKIIGDIEKHNPDSIFYGKSVVFTGTLSSMIRAEAQKIIADIGGILGNIVTKDTDFLVVGQQDYKVVGDDGMSNKQEKAIKIIEKGALLEILSEDDFLRNI